MMGFSDPFRNQDEQNQPKKKQKTKTQTNSGNEIGTKGVVEPGWWLQHTHVHDRPPEVPWQATLPAAGRSSK